MTRSSSPRQSVHLHRDPALDSHAYRRGPWKLIVGHHLVPFIFTKVNKHHLHYCHQGEQHHVRHQHRGVQLHHPYHLGIQRDCRPEGWLRRRKFTWFDVAADHRLLELGHRRGERSLLQVRYFSSCQSCQTSSSRYILWRVTDSVQVGGLANLRKVASS